MLGVWLVGLMLASFFLSASNAHVTAEPTAALFPRLLTSSQRIHIGPRTRRMHKNLVGDKACLWSRRLLIHHITRIPECMLRLSEDTVNSEHLVPTRSMRASRCAPLVLIVGGFLFGKRCVLSIFVTMFCPCFKTRRLSITC